MAWWSCENIRWYDSNAKSFSLWQIFLVSFLKSSVSKIFSFPKKKYIAVSIGGSAGFFIGSSVLGLIEIDCGCIPFFYPNQVAEPKPVCSYQRLKTCFPDKQELFHEFREMRNGVEQTVNCNCLQNCVDSNVVVERYQHLKGTKELLGSIGGLMVMRKYPLIRFQREVIFTLTDFFGKLS